MTELTRRTFIGGVAAAAGAAAAASVSPAAAAQAAVQATPARLGKQRLHGDIRDIKHVVILMQENRSFDHYFGSLRGVRGFGDRATITLPGGLPVWQQPTTRPGTPIATTQFPWRLSAAAPTDYPPAHQPPNSEAGAQGYGGTPHGWDDQHGAWYGGWMNGWVFAKGGLTTLGYLNRADIPFQYALADAYTVGDAYHCSVLSATGPNRTYLWSGTIDAQRKFSDFVAFSGGDELGKFLKWQSYPETLQAAGVSWKVYQGSDNFGDNGAEYFATFAQFDPEQGGTPAPGNVFYDNGVAIVPEPFDAEARNGDNLALAIKNDVLGGTLPQVSWVVTNQAYSEHPDGAPNDGAYYVYQVLQALNADPDVFNSTLVIVDYDENDGQFDHVPPPVRPGGHHGRVLRRDLRHARQPRRHPAAAGRPGLPRSAAAGLAVDPRRLGDLGGLRPHLGAAAPGEVDDGDRHPGDLPEHQRLAAQRVRRPARRLRLRLAGLRAARPARTARADR